MPFTINGITKNFSVHRLVAITFEIPNPDNKPFINHKNGIKWDNRLENLEWSTRKENARHAIDTGLLKYSRGNEHSNSKLTEQQVLEIRERFKPKICGYKQLAEEYNVTIYTIKDILSRSSWKHI